MWVLLASVACSVAVSVLLKLARQQNIHIDQAIAVNYAVAAALTMVLLRPHPAALLEPSASWTVLIALGVLLPSVFLAMGAAVRYAGIVLSDAAQRLSLLIPLLASFVLFNEAFSLGKLTGMTLAMLALVCLLARPKPGKAPESTGWRPVLLLLAVWAGYGCIDVLFKQLAASGLSFSGSLLAAFLLSGLLLGGHLLLQRTHWNRPSIIGGLLLGALNFGNIYFYLKAHQHYSEHPTLVFAAMNIGVIGLGTLIGAGIFRERLSAINAVGLTLAVVAVLFLMPR